LPDAAKIISWKIARQSINVTQYCDEPGDGIKDPLIDILLRLAFDDMKNVGCFQRADAFEKDRADK
jgi:hypothetical protein